MVVCSIGSLTEFVTELIMSIIENSSLQHTARAMILASIIVRAISVCSYFCHKKGQSAKAMMNPVHFLVQAGSVCSSRPYIPTKPAAG